MAKKISIDVNLQEIMTLISIRNYIATAVNSNCKQITKQDINDLHDKMAEIDVKVIGLIKEMKV